MSQSATDLKKLFQTAGPSIGLTAQGSSALIQNLNATVTPMCFGGPLTPDEEETDDFRLVFFVFDGSGSMDVVEDIFRDSVNEVLVPGLLGGAAPIVGAIRYNGIVFRDRVFPLIPANIGWKRLKDEKLVLTESEYRAGGSTALHQAIMDGITALSAYAIQLTQKTGSYPQCSLAVLSDGANNQPPFDAALVRQAISGCSAELFDFLFLGFQTNEPVDFRQIALDLGFPPDNIQDSRPAARETKEQMKKRMRNAMGVFSQSITGSVSRTKVASKPSASKPAGGGTAASGLWSGGNP